MWEGRISPVLDTATRLWVCDIEAGVPQAAQTVEIRPTDMRQRTQFICNLGVHTLLCGAISRPLHSLLLIAGIAVRPCLTGAVEDVAQAYTEGCLTDDRFLLPGCRRQRRRGCSMGMRGRGCRRRKNKEQL